MAKGRVDSYKHCASLRLITREFIHHLKVVREVSTWLSIFPSPPSCPRSRPRPCLGRCGLLLHTLLPLLLWGNLGAERGVEQGVKRGADRSGRIHLVPLGEVFV